MSALDQSDLDKLEEFYAAYVGLQVLAGVADADSQNVASVLAVLNQALERQIAEFAHRRSGLRLVE